MKTLIVLISFCIMSIYSGAQSFGKQDVLELSNDTCTIGQKRITLEKYKRVLGWSKADTTEVACFDEMGRLESKMTLHLGMRLSDYCFYNEKSELSQVIRLNHQDTIVVRSIRWKNNQVAYISSDHGSFVKYEYGPDRELLSEEIYESKNDISTKIEYHKTEEGFESYEIINGEEVISTRFVRGDLDLFVIYDGARIDSSLESTVGNDFSSFKAEDGKWGLYYQETVVSDKFTVYRTFAGGKCIHRVEKVSDLNHPQMKVKFGRKRKYRVINYHYQ